ncbi:hypothetical protein [Pseudomonas putida]
MTVPYSGTLGFYAPQGYAISKGALNAPIVPLTHPIQDLIVLKPVSAQLTDLDFSNHY